MPGGGPPRPPFLFASLVHRYNPQKRTKQNQQINSMKPHEPMAPGNRRQSVYAHISLHSTNPMSSCSVVTTPFLSTPCPLISPLHISILLPCLSLCRQSSLAPPRIPSLRPSPRRRTTTSSSKRRPSTRTVLSSSSTLSAATTRGWPTASPPRIASSSPQSCWGQTLRAASCSRMPPTG